MSSRPAIRVALFEKLPSELGMRIVALALLTACQSVANQPAPASPIGADVAFLSSQALAGREAGTPGGDSAAAFLEARFHELGLRPAFRQRCPTAPSCPESY